MNSSDADQNVPYRTIPITIPYYNYWVVATQIFSEISPLFGEDFHFDYFFQMSWNHQLVQVATCTNRRSQKLPYFSDLKTQDKLSVPQIELANSLILQTSMQKCGSRWQVSNTGIFGISHPEKLGKFMIPIWRLCIFFKWVVKNHQLGSFFWVLIGVL